MGDVILDSYSHCKISVIYSLPIFNKTPLKFPILWVLVMFPKILEKIPELYESLINTTKFVSNICTLTCMEASFQCLIEIRSPLVKDQ